MQLRSAARRALLTVLPLLVLTGCGLAGTNSAGYIPGDGSAPREIQNVADRGAPVDLSGTTLQGDNLDLKSTRGKVTVVNVWGSWCGDCVREADFLQQAHKRLGSSVPFVGIDVRDTSPAPALAFERGHHVTYPSIYSPKGTAVLAFSSSVSPRTTPATLVLDTQGRVAAIIGGTVPSTLTLVDVVRDVQKMSRDDAS
jgi:thiol-disulfide isomerase/thioredoxin